MEKRMEKRKLLGRTILIVEDVIGDALNLQDALAEAGARVLTAYRPQRALEHAEQPRLRFPSNVDDGLGSLAALRCLATPILAGCR